MRRDGRDATANIPDGLVEDALEVALGEGRALEVLVGLDLLGAEQGLVVGHGLHALLAQGVERVRVFAEIELRSDEDDGDVGRVVVDLGVPLQEGPDVSEPPRTGGRGRGQAGKAYLGLDVIEGRRADDGEADEEDVGLGVGQGPKPIIVLLACGIPEPQADGLPINHHAGRVVVEPAGVAIVSRRPGDRASPSRNGGRQGGEARGGTNTVGMYSPGKAFVVYEMRRHVCRIDTG